MKNLFDLGKTALSILLSISIVGCILAYIVTPVSADEIPVNSATVPDINFRRYIVEIVLDETFNVGGSYSIDPETISSCTQMNCTGRNIANLEGIEMFTALTSLDCGYNSLTSLNLTSNTALTTLYCNSNSLERIDLRRNTALTTLYCYSNQLTSLDVSSNTALTTLYCYFNQLTSLDVSSNTALTTLNCSYNSLTSLDLTSNTALTTLYCSNNSLTSLDVSTNTALTSMQCDSNKRVVTPDDSGIVTMSSLDPNFDIAKASISSGGQIISGNLKFSEGSSEIIYSYDCGNNHTALFKIVKKPVITIATLDNAAFGTAKSNTINAIGVLTAGSNFTFTMSRLKKDNTNVSTPNNYFNVNSDGVISDVDGTSATLKTLNTTPTGIYTFNITATDSNGITSDAQEFTLVVNSIPTITENTTTYYDAIIGTDLIVTATITEGTAPLNAKVSLDGTTYVDVTLTQNATPENTYNVTLPAALFTSPDSSAHNILLRITDANGYVANAQIGVVRSVLSEYDADTTIADITQNGTIWLAETSGENSIWYGLDNSAGVFEVGSHFWVKCLDKTENSVEWDTCYANLDAAQKAAVDSNKLQLFLIGVTKPDGTEYTDFSAAVSIYVQLPDNWNADDIVAIFVSSGADETLSVTCKSMEYPNGSDNFAVLVLNHFSAYAMYDKIASPEITPLPSKAAEITPLPTTATEIQPLPSTGDDTNILANFVLLSVSALLGIMVYYTSRKNKKQYKK